MASSTPGPAKPLKRNPGPAQPSREALRHLVKAARIDTLSPPLTGRPFIEARSTWSGTSRSRSVAAPDRAALHRGMHVLQGPAWRAGAESPPLTGRPFIEATPGGGGTPSHAAVAASDRAALHRGLAYVDKGCADGGPAQGPHDPP